MKKILIIDDDKAMVGLLRDLFEEAHYRVESALNGEEGLAKIPQLKPHLVVLDLKMPKLRGAGVFHELREADGSLKMPVIIISGEGGANDFYESMGAVFFQKPFDLGSFLSTAEKLIEQKYGPAALLAAGKNRPAAEGKKNHYDPDLVEYSVDPRYMEWAEKHREALKNCPEKGRIYAKKVLIADHLSSFVCQTAVLLGHNGCQVDAVGRGKDVLKKVDAFMPEILLIRLELPDETGDKVILKLHEQGSRIYVVLYTAAEDNKVQKMVLNSILKMTYNFSGLSHLIETDSPEILLDQVKAFFK